MEITTARLHIRDLMEEDAEPLHWLRTNPAVYRYNHFGPETLHYLISREEWENSMAKRG